MARIRILPASKWTRRSFWGNRAIGEKFLNVGKKKLTQIDRINAGNGTQQRASSFAIASALRNPQTKRILENDTNTVIDIAEKQRNKGLRRSVTHNAQRIRANKQQGKDVAIQMFNVFEVPIRQRLQFTSRIASRRKKISPISYSILDPKPAWNSDNRKIEPSTTIGPIIGDMIFEDSAVKYSVPESRNLYANADLTSDYLSPKQDKMDLKNRRRQTLAWDAFYLKPNSRNVHRIYDKGYDHDAYKTRRNRTNKPVKLTQVKGQRKSDIMMYGTEDRLQQAKYIQAQKDLLQSIVDSKEFAEHQKKYSGIPASSKTFNENIANRKPSTVTTDSFFDFLMSEMDKQRYRIGIPKNRYERTQREVADLYMQPYNAMRDRLFSTHPDVQRQSQLIAEEIARQDAKSAKNNNIRNVDFAEVSSPSDAKYRVDVTQKPVPTSQNRALLAYNELMKDAPDVDYDAVLRQAQSRKALKQKTKDKILLEQLLMTPFNSQNRIKKESMINSYRMGNHYGKNTNKTNSQRTKTW